MSTDIQPVSGLRVKYVRGDTDRSEVVMFEDAQQHTGVQIQAAGEYEIMNMTKETLVLRSRVGVVWYQLSSNVTVLSKQMN